MAAAHGFILDFGRFWKRKKTARKSALAFYFLIKTHLLTKKGKKERKLFCFVKLCKFWLKVPAYWDKDRATRIGFAHFFRHWKSASPDIQDYLEGVPITWELSDEFEIVFVSLWRIIAVEPIIFNVHNKVTSARPYFM